MPIAFAPNSHQRPVLTINGVSGSWPRLLTICRRCAFVVRRICVLILHVRKDVICPSSMQRRLSANERQLEDVSRLSSLVGRLTFRKIVRDLAGYPSAERSDRLGFSGVDVEGLCAAPKRIQPWPK